jgi:hypothetical protein
MARTPPSGGSARQASYANPLRGLINLAPSRIDMGVDYSGEGPVYPIGPAVITEVDQSWAGGYGDVGPGTFIAYRFTGGPLKDRYWYTAENIQPAVKVGQKVSPSTPIGYAQGGFETGFAEGPSAPGTTLAKASGQVPAKGDPGRYSTGWGIAASDVLAATGAPPGQVTARTTSSGSPPPGWEGIIAGIGQALSGGGIGGLVGGTAGHIPSGLGWLEEIGHWIGVAVTDLTDVHMWISLGWLGLGLILIMIGLFWWIRSTKTYQKIQSGAVKAAETAAVAA